MFLFKAVFETVRYRLVEVSAFSLEKNFCSFAIAHSAGQRRLLNALQLYEENAAKVNMAEFTKFPGLEKILLFKDYNDNMGNRKRVDFRCVIIFTF